MRLIVAAAAGRRGWTRSHVGEGGTGRLGRQARQEDGNEQAAPAEEGSTTNDHCDHVNRYYACQAGNHHCHVWRCLLAPHLRGCENDDIIHLPVHTAINLWVAQGTPRAAFVAQTLPMEELYDPQLAQHHLEAQRARGGHHLNHLAAPLGQQPGEPSADQNGTRAHEPEQPGHRPRPATTRAGLPADQLLLEDL